MEVKVANKKGKQTDCSWKNIDTEKLNPLCVTFPFSLEYLFLTEVPVNFGCTCTTEWNNIQA